MAVEKVGRNDPCPCGSGKKYKQCCLLKNKPAGKKTLKAMKATWISKPTEEKAPPNLLERTFGKAIESTKESAYEKKKEQADE